MEAAPSQDEIDAVAHFVEAVRELKSSAFCVEEFQSLSISVREGAPKEEARGNFPDPHVVRAALVPFRRIWNQNEPCNYIKVGNIVKRYIPVFRALLGPLEFSNESSLVGGMGWFRNKGVTPTEVIDIWLNTRVHHVGKSGRQGRFTREDFDRLNEEIGPVQFEYYFLSAVREVCVACFNLLQCAEGFLNACASNGQHPSFQIVPHRGEDRVQRSTPGYTPEENTPRQRVWRLRRRRRYDGLNYFLEVSGLSDEQIAALISECDSFDEFVQRNNFAFERTEDFIGMDTSDFTHMGGCIDNEKTAWRNRRCRRGFVAKRTDGRFVYGEDYMPVLNDQYAEFRDAFLANPFS